MDGLRQAGQQDDLPRGLLARAELHRFTGAFSKALNDLDEAFTIATRGGMRLHEADCHLEYARLYLAHLTLRGVPQGGTTKQSPIDAAGIASQTALAMTAAELKDQARAHLAMAKALIEQTGYRRRDGEVKELEEMTNEE